MSARDPELHVQAKSVYLDDSPDPPNCLYCSVLFSPIARGRISRLDMRAARETGGVRLVLAAEGIPGENQIGTLLPDEPLLAHSEVTFAGQPIAAVYAETERAARAAVGRIELEIDAEKPVLDPREAFERGELITPLRTFQMGDTKDAFSRCSVVVSGRTETGAQEHFYLEGQGAIALPREGGGLFIRSSTQSPTGVQKSVARVCALTMNEVEVDVGRLGGGFGGKEVQANQWAALAGVGCLLTGRPVKLLLKRSEDMRVTGKRHPYSADYKIGLDSSGRIIAYEAMYYQNSGATADLSPSILERTLFHSTGSYFVPNVRVSGACCRTNLPPFTAFRGFGGPQAMFVIEAALHEAAKRIGLPVERLQRLNLIADGQTFPYGMPANGSRAAACWDRAFEKYGIEERIAKISNQSATRMQSGYALMPICFGISFTSMTLNQARALVHVYHDGSVGVSTGAVEMGQGVNQKIVDVVAACLGIRRTKVRIETTNTTRVANTSPTAASTGTDLNGRAALLACEQIRKRLLAFAASTSKTCVEKLTIEDGEVYDLGKPAGLSWEQLIGRAYGARVHLSAEAHYATPGIYFDSKTEKGVPFAYHVYGTAYAEVTIDRLLGTYRIDRVQIVHDGGANVDRLIDRGQVEGGLLQGIGWLTGEEMIYDSAGRPLTATAGTYKVPDLFSTPSVVEIEFLESEVEPATLLNAKAVGEPPFMYGIAAYFALRKAAEGAVAQTAEPVADAACAGHRAPLTPERVMELLNPQGQD